MWLVSGLVSIFLFTPFNCQDNFTLSNIGMFTNRQDVIEAIFNNPWAPYIFNKRFQKRARGTSDVYKNQLFRFPVVSTNLGQLRGTVTKSSRRGSLYTAFMGIPYAEPPIGLLRFQRPVPKKSWRGILDARREGHNCHAYSDPKGGAEDCLFINVFSPTTNFQVQTPPKAVMVYIFGGAFSDGGSNTTLYAPDFLVDKNVVVVTFNYRVGPLGFLSLQSEDVPGNAGLKDQTLALRWVKENIECFGGDSERITVFGQSAGAASAMYHLISPSSRGLFNKIILQSGTPLAPWGYTDPKTAVIKAFQLGKQVGCDYHKTQKKKLYQCLLETPASLLTKEQGAALPLDELLKVRPLVFIPTSEPTTADPFITKDPEEYLTNGEFEHMPSIMGINSAEDLLFHRIVEMVDPTGSIAKALSRGLTLFIPQSLQKSISVRSLPDFEEILEEFYLRNKTFPLINVINILNDVQFLLPTITTAKIMARHAKVYLYHFTFEGKYNYQKQIAQIMNLNGAAHTDEVGYLWNVEELKQFYSHHQNQQSSEEQMVDSVSTLWTDFAKTGQPLATWDSFREKDVNYLEITQPLQVKNRMASESLSLWNNIYQKIFNIRPY